MSENTAEEGARPLARDGKPGCPVTVWDGPYSTRCSLGASVGRCAYHGTFAMVTPPGATHANEEDEG